MKVVHEFTLASRNDPQTVIALIAHDAKKSEILHLARAYKDLLATCTLIATRSTGSLLADELGLEVECMASGPEGGDLQIGARIVEGGVDAVIFLRDPLTAHPHDPDITALMKVCDISMVPLATNTATAHMVLRSLSRRVDYVMRTTHPSVAPFRGARRRVPS